MIEKQDKQQGDDGYDIEDIHCADCFLYYGHKIYVQKIEFPIILDM